jgi:hypothetical protein
MKKIALTIILMCIVCSAFSAVWREVSPCGGYIVGELIIWYEKSPFTDQDINDMILKFAKYGIVPLDPNPVYDPDCMFQMSHQTFQFDESSVPDFKWLQTLLNFEVIVRRVSRVKLVRLATNDTFYRDQWYLRNRGDGSRGNPIFLRTGAPATAGADISMEPAWRLYRMLAKNRTQPVAVVIDTGFHIEHE